MRSLRPDDPRRIGEYTVMSRLGHGAMGTVFLARSRGGRQVALKVVRAELADEPGFRDRFRQEVAAMRTVGGFWTAAVVDADPDAAAPWVACEYVPGPTLHEYVSTRGPLAVPMARAMIAGLAEALHVIHSAGLVHRDLKPSNVLLAADGPRVIDFGIAKATGAAALTSTGMLVGTPGFLAPEQIEGRDATAASDVFSLGAVVVHATTGAGPFGDGDAAGLLYRIAHTPPELTAVPAELRSLVAHCLARSGEQRPTPSEVLARIGSFDPVEWAPDRTPEQPTALKAPAAPRSPTRQYTRTARPAPDDHRPAAPPPPPPADQPDAARGRAVFRTSRRSAVLMCAAVTLAALMSLALSDGAGKGGNGAVSLLFLVGFVLLAVPAVRYALIAVRPRRWLEVSDEGLAVGAGSRANILSWSEMARVRVIEDKRRPWLVVWITGPATGKRAIGPLSHGGHRVFPIGHERRKAARDKEIRELRAALDWYAKQLHDPNP
ncbi:MAG: serine/threonine-protein kinase [Actinophytocola sp.]|uniref:serine/threonine-protein kinase n=1 Tax=Actinophytocola sp. TaxID=1872138 RepID=UPI003C756E70